MTETSVDASKGTAQEEIDQLRQEVEQLRFALHHRPETDRVVGMIMLAASCSADTAWTVLSTVSQHTHLKVRDIAAVVSAHMAAGQGLTPDIAAVLRVMLSPPQATVPSASSRQQKVPAARS